MIKIAIIIILMLLLVITLYSYYCLSSRMINFEKLRLEYILKKEEELNDREKNINIVADCSIQNEKYQQAIENINSIIDKMNLPPGSICKKYTVGKDKQIIDNLKSIILEEKLPENSNLNNCAGSDVSNELVNELISENNLKMYNEVPPNFILPETESELMSETQLVTESELVTDSETM